jgi:hypothetical protein
VRRRYRLTKLVPFLPKLINLFFSKALDFTDFPGVKGNISLLIEERNAYFINSLDPIAANRWNLKVIDLLTKKKSNIKLIRIGSPNDGGYLVPEAFCNSHTWICIGLGDNIEFENELAKRKCLVDGFDHTIPSRPRKLDKSVKYHAKGWGTSEESQLNTSISTLQSLLLLSTQHSANESLWSLKFDIEGNEWKSLDQLETLRFKPAVIVCEIHGLLWGSTKYHNRNIVKDLEKLLKNYLICSVNGNNFSPYIKNFNYGLYDVAELTLIRKDLEKLQPKAKPSNKNSNQRNNSFIEQMPIGRLIQ